MSDPKSLLRLSDRERELLRHLVHGELEYINDDAPCCLFDNEEEAGALLAKLEEPT